MALPNAIGAKGNDGSRRRNRILIKAGVWLFLALAAYQILWSYWLAGVGIPDYEVDKVTGQTRIRRRPELLYKHDHLLGRQVPT